MKIIEKMVQQDIIQKENKEWMEFGLRQAVHIMGNWCLVICIGLLFQLEIWQSLFFYFSYCIVRIFAGGYHAKTRPGCYICSMICIALAFLIYQQITINKIVCCLLYMIAVITIICYSPMDNPNKRLSVAEKVHYRKTVRCVLLLYSLLFAGTMCISFYRMYVLSLLAVLFAGIMVFAGLLQEKISIHR